MDLLDLTGRTSYSSLHTYMECPERWRQVKVLERSRPPGWALVGGKAVHTLTEWYDLYGHRGADANGVAWDWDEQWSLAFAQEIGESERSSGVSPEEWRVTGKATKDWPEKETRAWWEHHGPVMGRRYAEWRERSPWPVWRAPDGKVGVELELAPQVGNTVVLAYIDRVFQIGDALAVVDVKSGRLMPEHLLQLAVYAALVDLVYGMRPAIGAYYDARKGALVHVEELSELPTGLVVDLFQRFVIAAESEAYVPSVGRHCTWCEVAPTCSWSKALTFGLRLRAGAA